MSDKYLTKSFYLKKLKILPGSITFSPDNKYIFYSKLDENHRPKSIYRHEIGQDKNADLLIYKEKNERFNVSIGLSSDDKYYFIYSGDHTTSEISYFPTKQKNLNHYYLKKAKQNIIYSLNSWKNYFYIHTNEEAEDFKIIRCKHNDIKNTGRSSPCKKRSIDWRYHYS